MKSYAETFQGILFTAAAETYDIATTVLNDCTLASEFQGATYAWSRDKARQYAEAAQELKERALSLTPVVRAPVKFNRAQRRYSLAVDRHLRLRAEYTGTTRIQFTEAVSSGRETWKASS
jgi:hypothetical protein